MGFKCISNPGKTGGGVKSDSLDYNQNVVIVGTGPSGLILSQCLQGIFPVYSPHGPFGPHPDRYIHQQLSNPEFVVDDNTIVNMDPDQPPLGGKEVFHIIKAALHNPELLSYMSRIGDNRHHPISILLDMLIAPREDLYSDAQSMESRISWVKTTGGVKIPHLLIGQESSTGGQWASSSNPDNDSIRSLSYAQMLSLPIWTFNHYYTEKYSCPLPAFYRPTRSQVSEYYSMYGKRFCRPYLRLQQTVACVEEEDGGGGGFLIKLIHSQTGKMTCLHAQKLVLATGISTHNLPLNTTTTTGAAAIKIPPSLPILPSAAVIVIGSGFSAADQVICLNNRDIPVIHLFEWGDEQSRSPLEGFTKEVYPEYALMYKRMKRAGTGNYYPSFHGLYTGVPNGKIATRNNNHSLQIITDEMGQPLAKIPSLTKITTRIGRAGYLGFLSSDLLNKGQIHDPWIGKTTKRRINNNWFQLVPNLYMIGSISGDAYVRYCLGSCITVAHHLGGGGGG